MGRWFEEQLELNNGRIVKIEYTSLVESHQSLFQKIDIYDTVAYGKMLVHDNVIMLTEFDEAHYHEMITHVALNTHANPERIAIIGGGDGGTLREVLKHPTVKLAHLCEIDGAVITLCKKHFPALANSFADPRVEVFEEDGAVFVQKQQNFYDVIIVDSSDPIGPAEVLFQEQFYRHMFQALRADGIVITQSESFLFHEKVIRDIVHFNKKIFPIYRYYYTLVPTYPSGVIGFSFCSKHYDPLLDFKVERAQSIPDLKYYNEAIHQAAFVLPRFAAAFIDSQDESGTDHP